MTSILDQVAKTASWFRPTTDQEFVALRLAQRLGEPQAAPHYVQLLSQHAEDRIVQAYQRALQANPAVTERARCFHACLAEKEGS